MKIIENTEAFKPIRITFELETKEEATNFWCLFNHGYITDVYEINCGQEVRDVLANFENHEKFDELDQKFLSKIK